jgi:hypothetical protein
MACQLVFKELKVTSFFLSLKAVGKLTPADYTIITPIIDCALNQVKGPKVDF